MTFWLLFAFDAVMTAVLLFFFTIGIADRSVSASNIGLWLLLLGVAAAFLLGGLALKRRAHDRIGAALLLLPALPGLAYLAFVLMMVVMQPRWN
ncbi:MULTISPECIES: osmoprotectant transporter permease [Sphingomonas]|uniref:Osmoprotectant transporter permease n=1 Tax=Edaphosphingomonas fennica TaxID=114404 RepID=A0A2T4HQ08_9SPHN|nr:MULTISPECIES: osmoprotectant transporter permease [Sphingomonas]MDX3886030.1 osmoprotectant transporter permease [Sphingomonas sp.]PTD17897.1 osmoprotectant transporter permease [Sphingomonas fennica]